MQFKFELSKSPGRAHCTKCHWFTSYSLWEIQFRIQEADSLTPYRGTQSTDPTFYIFIGHLSSVVLRNLMRSRPHNTEFNQYALPRNLINTIKRKFILTNCTSALQVSPPPNYRMRIYYLWVRWCPHYSPRRGVNQKAPTSRSYMTLGSGILPPNHGHCGCLRPPSPRYREWRTAHRTHNLREQEIIIFFFFFLYQA